MLLSRFLRSRSTPRMVPVPDQPATRPTHDPIEAIPRLEAVDSSASRDLVGHPARDRPHDSGPDHVRPTVFPVRERGAPGREYGALLALPGDLGQSARKARLLSVQGILHARQGRLEAARGAFSLALAADPSVDFAALPTFWDLTRAGCQSAVSAYEDAGLPARAAELQTRISYVMGPRNLRLVRSDERRSS